MEKLTTSGIRTYMRGLPVHAIGHHTNTRPVKACKCFLLDILSWSHCIHVIMRKLSDDRYREHCTKCFFVISVQSVLLCNYMYAV